MKPEAQRIAIAEFCGWKDCRITANPLDGKIDWLAGVHPKRQMLQSVPAYTTDLNAMHEAEEKLTREQAIPFRFRLTKNSDGPKADFCSAEAAMCHATAAQRAEALLRTIGKWTDD